MQVHFSLEFQNSRNFHEYVDKYVGKHQVEGSNFSQSSKTPQISWACLNFSLTFQNIWNWSQEFLHRRICFDDIQHDQTRLNCSKSFKKDWNWLETKDIESKFDWTLENLLLMTKVMEIDVSWSRKARNFLVFFFKPFFMLLLIENNNAVVPTPFNPTKAFRQCPFHLRQTQT